MERKNLAQADVRIAIAAQIAIVDLDIHFGGYCAEALHLHGSYTSNMYRPPMVNNEGLTWIIFVCTWVIHRSPTLAVAPSWSGAVSLVRPTRSM